MTIPNPVDQNTLALFNQVSADNPAAAEAMRQFGITQESLQPYIQAGTEAIPQVNAMAGLGGDMSPMISGIANSDYFKAQKAQGADEILQNASAKGGLRGGNTESAIAQYSPALLNQLLQQKYGQLAGLMTSGQNAGAGLSGIATGTGANVSGALTSAGNLAAQKAAQEGQTTANNYSTFAGLAGLAKSLF